MKLLDLTKIKDFLPLDILNIVYEYDTTYRDMFQSVLVEMKSIQVECKVNRMFPDIDLQDTRHEVLYQDTDTVWLPVTPHELLLWMKRGEIERERDREREREREREWSEIERNFLDRNFLITQIWI